MEMVAQAGQGSGMQNKRMWKFKNGLATGEEHCTPKAHLVLIAVPQVRLDANTTATFRMSVSVSPSLKLCAITFLLTHLSTDNLISSKR